MLKIVSISTNKPPELKPTENRLYRGILITVKDEKDYLTEIFTYNGLKDKIPEAEVTLNGESSWRWWANNGISAGIAAFTPDTWNGNCKSIGKYEDLNPFEQMQCLAKLWKRGEQGRWDVWCLHYNFGNTNKQCRGLHP